FDLYIGFVNARRTQCWAFTSPCLIRNLRRVSNNPPLQCRMINLYTTLRHNFLEIAIGNGIAHIENRIKDDPFGEVNSFEINGHPLSAYSMTRPDGGKAQ